VPKVLLIAPTCDPNDVGEAWVAYQWAKGLAARHDVTLLTYHKRGKQPAAKTLSDVHVVEWTEPPLVGRAERLNSMLKPGYAPFFLRARRWIRNALARGDHFDIAHQPVPVAMRYPSPILGLGVPYVIGPVGGGLISPPGFADDDTAPWYVGLRSLDGLRLRRDPLLRRTYEGADCVLGIADYVRESLEGMRIRRFEIMSETGIEQLPPAPARDAPRRPIRLLFVGRLIRTKGARDAVHAMQHLTDLDIVLDVVGDGYDRSACEQLAAELGLARRVVFHGRQPRTSVTRFYRQADIFVFPSYREPGGNVTYEAMAAGLPVITSDRGGPGAAIDDSSGIRVTPTAPHAFSRTLAAAIRRLVDNEELRKKLGEGAYRRVGEIGLWDQKINLATTLYDEILAT
jgi:glycosyltransferase involved in cell wall biosynthesis